MRGVLAALLLAVACATPHARPVLLEARGARVELAERLAPDLYARALRAGHDARAASDPQERADHEARAELLLEAAVAEAERIATQAELTALEQQEAAAAQSYASSERERRQLEQAMARAETAARLRAELAAARALAQRATAVQGKDRHEREQARRAALQVLLEHASLLLFAARALGLAPEHVSAFEQSLARAGAEASSTRALSSALSAVTELERALREAKER